MAILLAPSTSVMSRLAVPRKTAAQRVLCRAAPEDKSSGATVFFAGEAYTEQEWRDAVSSGKLMNIASTSAPQAKAPQPQASFGEVMAFSGAAPEVVNGRLAMLGFVAALGAEFATEKSVLNQVAVEPTGIVAAFVLVIAGSLVTIMQRKEGKLSLGPFNANAELTNGRAAMIGFAAMLGIEFFKGTALF